jgi:hypothetical protein
MNLVNQLHKIAKRNYQSKLAEANEALDSVKANIEMEDKRDIDLLKHFGTEVVMNEQSNSIKDITKKIAGEIVTKEDIRSVCLSYNLRFLSSENYKKEIPLRVLNDLRNFQEDNKISDAGLTNKLMVIAPKSHFLLGKRPIKDPILLFQKSRGVYKVVSKWGNDFSFFRRISGFFASNWILVVIISTFALANSFFTYLTINGQDGTCFTGNVGVILVLSFIFYGPFDSNFESLRTKWDEPYL